MFFIVFSMPRTGSTALYRALKIASGRDIAYEPDYGDSWQTLEQLHQFYDSLRRTFTGVKHVWDPNGYPFGNPLHLSTPGPLQQAEHWCAVNKLVLAYDWDKIIFLRRRDGLARTLSDFIGRQTDLWGHKPKARHSPRELEGYRASMSGRELSPVDLDQLEWYLVNAPRLEQELIASVPGPRLRVIDHEELFGSGTALETRLETFRDMCGWMGLPDVTCDPDIQRLFSPSSKYNDLSILHRLPNLRQAEEIAARLA